MSENNQISNKQIDYNSPRNWTEDFRHENGNYSRRCCVCSEYFIGHKRRVVCKVCDGKEK